MGITSAFFSATSGINATSRALTEIGNNIANAQTIGFKTRTVSFGDLFGANLGLGGASSALVEGRGVRVLGVDPSFTQGSLQTTSNALDLAIDGDGFFQVKSTSGDTHLGGEDFNNKLIIYCLSEFCKKNHIMKLSLFGSALRDDFQIDSDIDLRTPQELSKYFRDEVLAQAEVQYAVA